MGSYLYFCGMSEEKKQEEFPVIDSLWNYSDPKETAEKFRALIPAVKEANDSPYLGELLGQLARTQSLQMNFVEAHVILDMAERVIAESAKPEEMTRAKVRYHLERGRTYNSSNEKLEAMAQFKFAYEIAEKDGLDSYAIDALHMLAIAEEGDAQMEWHLKALAMAENSKDEKARKWLGPLYNNIGWTYHDIGQYDEAMEVFQKSLAWRQEQKDAKGTFIAHWTIGHNYRSLNDIDKALEIQMQLLSEINEGEADPDGHVYEEIGECLLIKEQTDEAKPYFQQAYDLLSQDKWIETNEQGRLERLKSLAK